MRTIRYDELPTNLETIVRLDSLSPQLKKKLDDNRVEYARLIESFKKIRGKWVPKFGYWVIPLGKISREEILKLS